MAQQPADLEAFERKLRPIYEAIEVGNHKVNSPLARWVAMHWAKPTRCLHMTTCTLAPPREH